MCLIWGVVKPGVMLLNDGIEGEWRISRRKLTNKSAISNAQQLMVDMSCNPSSLYLSQLHHIIPHD